MRAGRVMLAVATVPVLLSLIISAPVAVLAEEAAVDPQVAALRAELAALKPRALQKRAEEAGIEDEALDEAESSEAIIELVVNKFAASLPIRPDRIGPGLSDEECTHANTVLGRKAVEDEEAWSKELEAMTPRLADAEVSSLSCLHETLETILKEAYEIKELTSEEALETNRGNTAKLDAKEGSDGLPLELGTPLQLVALNTLGPLLVHQDNYRLAAEVTIADIMLRSEKLKEDGPNDEAGKPFPNTIYSAMSLWYNIKAIVMFPEFPDLGIPRGALSGCTRVSRLLPKFAESWICQAKWALYHAENNICPGHPSGLDCASMALELYKEAFNVNVTLKADWHHWYEMGRGAAHPSYEKGGPAVAKEHYETGLAAAEAANDAEGIDALSFLVQNMEKEAQEKTEKEDAHRESFAKHK